MLELLVDQRDRTVGTATEVRSLASLEHPDAGRNHNHVTTAIKDRSCASFGTAPAGLPPPTKQ